MGTLRGPVEMHGAPTPEAYEALQRRHCVPRAATQAVTAYVNEGRWVADCACYGGVAVSPAWGVARCLECGLVYRVGDGTLVVPDAGTCEEIDTVLGDRPDAKNRNWLPTETVAKLRRENRHKDGA